MNPIVLPLNQFTTSSGGALVTEASQLRDQIPIGRVPKRVEVDGVVFDYTKADTDASGEDVYGWNYQSAHGRRLLIIND